MALLIGVWIDQAKAVLAVPGGGVTTIHSHVDAHPHWAGAQDGGGEKRFEARHAEQMNRFFDEVIGHLGAAQSLFLFGPGEAKFGLRNRLEHVKALEHVKVRVEPSDRITDAQIAAKVRELAGAAA